MSAVSGAQVGTAALSGPSAVQALLNDKLEQNRATAIRAQTAPDAASKDGWLYLDNPADQADYKSILPKVKTYPDPEAPLTVEVPDAGKTEALDRLYQMPRSFGSIDEARGWKPALAKDSGEWGLLKDIGRRAAARPPFANIDELSPAEQSKILCDPRRVYAEKQGLLDGSMPALPPPFPADTRPNAWLYLTDKGQQSIIEGRVPKVGVTDPETGRTVRLEPDRPTLDMLDTLYAMPPRFASVDEAKAWHQEPRTVKPGDDVLAVAAFNNTVASKRPWGMIDQFPPDVQQAIIDDPRLAYAGLKGLINQEVPEGAAPMRAHPTPSGRFASFEKEMGGYDPKWAPQATWVPGSGIMLPKEATFVPHKQKGDFTDFLGDTLIPAVASVGAGAIVGPLGFAGSTAFNAAGRALISDNPGHAAGLSVLGAFVGAGIEPAVAGASQRLGDVLGSRVVGDVLARGAAGALTSAALGGDPRTGAFFGGLSGAISSSRWSFEPDGASVGRVSPPDEISVVELEGGATVGAVTLPDDVVATATNGDGGTRSGEAAFDPAPAVSPGTFTQTDNRLVRELTDRLTSDLTVMDSLLDWASVNDEGRLALARRISAAIGEVYSFAPAPLSRGMIELKTGSDGGFDIFSKEISLGTAILDARDPVVFVGSVVHEQMHAYLDHRTSYDYGSQATTWRINDRAYTPLARDLGNYDAYRNQPLEAYPYSTQQLVSNELRALLDAIRPPKVE
ncbi:MAG: hypothetical protein IT384_04110 [Deltaproteobacteria bacterium]|nr:hypothetical protein [Deltaproteobacteria bacterium]